MENKGSEPFALFEFDDPYKGIQEKETEAFLKDFFTAHKTTPEARLRSSTLLVLAQSMDKLNCKGRDISRVVEEFNNTMTLLISIYEDASATKNENATELLNWFGQPDE